MKVRAVLNRDGGTFKSLDVDAFAGRAISVFGEHGHALTLDAVAGPDLVAALQSAAGDDGADLLMVGGGDGTVSTAAALAWKNQVPLGVLPAGTMNLFARAIGMPLDLDSALEALASGSPQPADIATANGRPFIHLFSVGAHPRLVQVRELIAYRSRLGKMLASIRAMGKVIARPPRFPVHIEVDGKTEKRRFSAVSVSNNRLTTGLPPLPAAVDCGELAVYAASEIRTALLIRIALGRLDDESDEGPAGFHRLIGHEVTLRFPGLARRAKASIDGELAPLHPEVHFVMHAGGLTVLAPASEDTRELNPPLPLAG